MGFFQGVRSSVLFVCTACFVALDALLVFAQQVQTVDPQELATMMREQKGKIVLVNTMSAIECADHSIAGSLCAPVETIRERVKRLPQDKLIVFYCETEGGVRCRKAAHIALEAGLQNVAVLDGGAVGWRKAGFEEISRTRVPRQIISSIAPGTLKEWIHRKRRIAIVDIRSPETFAKGHIDGAKNFSFHILHEKYAGIPKGKTIVMVDDKGIRSFLAASYLKNKGFENIVRLNGGMEAWQQAYGKR